MGAWSRVRSALGVTLVAHVVVLGLSLAPSIPLALLLHRAVGDTAAGDASLWEAGGAVLIEALHETGAGIGAVVLVWLAVGGLGALVAPWLTMSWLAALARPGRVSAALGTGALRYFPALAVSALHAPLLALSARGLLGDRPDLARRRRRRLARGAFPYPGNRSGESRPD